MSKIDMLISTMNKSDLEFINKMNINTSAVIINQITDRKLEVIEGTANIGDYKLINVKAKGLTKSRNLALQNSENEICVVCDDDIIYEENYSVHITNAYEKYSEADIIVFRVKNSKGKLYKNYSEKAKNVNFLTAMKVSSVEITFKRSSILENNIMFNELFGSGSRFQSGEEFLFLNEAIKKGLKVIFVPVTIAQLEDSESTWFKGYNKDFFISKGAMFYASSPFLSLLFIIQFAIRKYKLYKKECSIFKSITYMLKGCILYRSYK